ncbi:hypothetical protein HZB00_00300 [Candidatus Woesearchaeota archaeon]|nr:hypothetical protein [Candidatus Woesearchaeota archaeon]
MVSNPLKPIGGKLERVAEGEGVLTGGIMPDALKGALGKLFKYLFGAIKILVGLFVLFLIIWIPYKYWFASGGGAALIAHGEVAASDTGLPAAQRLAKAAGLNFLFGDSPVSYAYEADIDQSQINSEKMGVRIVSLEQSAKAEFGKPIKVNGVIEAASTLQDIDLVVNCQLDENDLVPARISRKIASGEQQNTIRILKNAEQRIDAVCEFPKGLAAPSDSSLPGAGKTYVTAGKVKMYATYNFVSRASHRTYFLSDQELQSFYSKGKKSIDIFKFYGIYGKDPQLGSDGKVKAVASPGPITLAIGTDASQPFAENTPYTFGITLSNNNDWRGELKKIEYTELQVPPFIRLEGDNDYLIKTGIVTCPFEFTGQTDKNQFRIYRLKQEYIAAINKECDKKTLGELDLTQSQCIDLFAKDKDQTYRCEFVSTRAPETVEYDLIRAESAYIYQTKKEVAVEAIRPAPTAASTFASS